MKPHIVKRNGLWRLVRNDGLSVIGFHSFERLIDFCRTRRL